MTPSPATPSRVHPDTRPQPLDLDAMLRAFSAAHAQDLTSPGQPPPLRLSPPRRVHRDGAGIDVGLVEGQVSQGSAGTLVVRRFVPDAPLQRAVREHADCSVALLAG